MAGTILSSEVGAAHLIAAILAMVCGAFVLFKPKGSLTHRRAGYFYLFFMIALNVTAFMIYRLFGKFGVFHALSIVSSLTLLAGMLPVILKKPAGGWLKLHFNFMYWSVIGLYAAFAAETLVRVPQTPFFGMVGVGTGLIMLLGYIGLFLNKNQWNKISDVFERRDRKSATGEIRELA